VTEVAPEVPIPALCGGCRRLFPTPLMLGPGGSVAFENCAAGPCPFCGANGVIPSGMYTFTDSVVELVATNALQRAQLERLRTIFEDARQAAAATPVAETVSGLERRIAEEVPEARPLLPALEAFFKANANTLAVLGVLITIIGTVAGVAGAMFAYPAWRASQADTPPAQAPAAQKPPVPEDDPPLTTRSVFRAINEAASSRTPPARRAATKVGRNDPCPCGSGKKKKKCHRD
jgi:hypothetical protein